MPVVFGADNTHYASIPTLLPLPIQGNILILGANEVQGIPSRPADLDRATLLDVVTHICDRTYKLRKT